MKDADRLHHEHMIATPRSWPVFPVLPLARSDRGLDLGVLVCCVCQDRQQVLTVIRANVLLLPPSVEELRKLPSEQFSSIDALLDAGWRVD